MEKSSGKSKKDEKNNHSLKNMVQQHTDTIMNSLDSMQQWLDVQNGRITDTLHQMSTLFQGESARTSKLMDDIRQELSLKDSEIRELRHLTTNLQIQLYEIQERQMVKLEQNKLPEPDQPRGNHLRDIEFSVSSTSVNTKECAVKQEHAGDQVHEDKRHEDAELAKAMLIPFEADCMEECMQDPDKMV